MQRDVSKPEVVSQDEEDIGPHHDGLSAERASRQPTHERRNGLRVRVGRSTDWIFLCRRAELAPRGAVNNLTNPSGGNPVKAEWLLWPTASRCLLTHQNEQPFPNEISILHYLFGENCPETAEIRPGAGLLGTCTCTCACHVHAHVHGRKNARFSHAPFHVGASPDVMSGLRQVGSPKRYNFLSWSGSGLCGVGTERLQLSFVYQLHTAHRRTPHNSIYSNQHPQHFSYLCNHPSVPDHVTAASRADDSARSRQCYKGG